MTLSSASTLAQVQASYDDNAAYAELGDTGMCASFITACRILLRRLPQEASHGNGRNTVQWNLSVILESQKKAERWLATQQTATNPSVVFPVFDQGFLG
ncbi:MAG TPA: hypothetical protein VG433_07965 [Pirellulales bacterium]|jgi:hypothetical protein|nr:hypothetical protein [Pirellulales bacterium]